MWCLSFLITFTLLTESTGLLQLYLPLTLKWDASRTGTFASVNNASRLVSLFGLLPLLIKWAADPHARSLTLIRLAALVSAASWALCTLVAVAI